MFRLTALSPSAMLSTLIILSLVTHIPVSISFLDLSARISTVEHRIPLTS